MPSNLIGEKRADESDDEEEDYTVEDEGEEEIDIIDKIDKDGKIDDVNSFETYRENKENDEEEESEEDDDEGWITPSNIVEVKRSMGVETALETDVVPVGCLTTDFAMQVRQFVSTQKKISF